MSWTGLVLFLIGTFVLRVAGGFVLAGWLGEGERWTRLLALVPVAIVSAVVGVQTFAVRQQLVVDARIVGVATAAVAAWRRLPLVFVVVLAAATTAAARRLGWR